MNQPNRPPGSLLAVEDLFVRYTSQGRTLDAVRGISFCVRPSEVVSLVGETGSGKSTAARAIPGLLPQPMAEVVSGRIVYERNGVEHEGERQLRRIRGSEIAMVFQQAGNSLDPCMTLGRQFEEVLARHRGMRKSVARRESKDLMELTGIPDPGRQLDAYAFQLSGGMRQRVALALALCGRPGLLIADEPTTALDVTTQAQVLDVLMTIRTEFDMSVLFITHDLGVVARISDYVYVMRAGGIVEHGDVNRILEHPEHAYTLALLAATRRLQDIFPTQHARPAPIQDRVVGG